MKGATGALVAILLALLAITMVAGLFVFVQNFQNKVKTSSETQMIELEIPPKMISFVCYDAYAYFHLSLSQGQQSVNEIAYYSVSLDTGQKQKEGFVNVSFSGDGRVYIPFAFNTNERYEVSLSGKKWKLKEYCRPVNDPHMVLKLAFDSLSVTDESDSKNTGTVNGGTIVNAKNGKGISLDGVSDFITVDNAEDLNSFTSFTVSIYFNYTGRGPYDNAYHTLISKSSTNNDVNSSYHFKVGNNSQTLQINVGNETEEYVLENNVNVADNLFHNAVLVYDNEHKEYDFYFDGVLEDNQSVFSGWVPAQNSNDLYLGKWNSYEEEYKGTIDEVRIYNRAFDADEVMVFFEAYD